MSGILNVLAAGKAAAGGAAPTWTATGNPAGVTTGTLTVTFSAVGIGTPAASDVIVAVYSSQSTIATSLTCNGVAMTKQVEESTVLSGLQLWSITASAAGVTGSSTTTFVAGAGSNMDSEFLTVGKLTGVNATPTATGSSATTSIGVTVPATGYAILGGFAASASAVTWTNATEDFATIFSGEALHMANATATATVSTTGGGVHLVYAAWGP